MKNSNDIFNQILDQKKTNSFQMIVLPNAEDRKLLHQFLENIYPALPKTSLRCEFFPTKESRCYKECDYCEQKMIKMEYQLGIEPNNIDESYSATCPTCGENLWWECNYESSDYVIYVEHNNIVAFGDYYKGFTKSNRIDKIESINDIQECKIIQILKNNKIFNIKNPENSLNKKRLNDYLFSFFQNPQIREAIAKYDSAIFDQLQIISFNPDYARSNKIVLVLDLNDTLTLLNDVDPDKTIDVVLNQIVAQNIFINSINLENYIKNTIMDKKEQRKTYGNLHSYAKTLLDQQIILECEFNKIQILYETYKKSWEKCARNGGFFESCYKLFDYVLKFHPDIKIQVQSFGNEIPKFIKEIKQRYPLVCACENIINFENYLNSSGNDIGLVNKKLLLEKIEEITDFYTLSYCRNNYAAWMNQGFGKPLIYSENTRTIFFDDNAYRCATIIKGNFKGEIYKVLKLEESSPYYRDVIQVDTSKALVDPNYFVDLLKILLN